MFNIEMITVKVAKQFRLELPLGFVQQQVYHIAALRLLRQRIVNLERQEIKISTNKGAIELWKKYGFEIIGTTPNGFRHSELGLVDAHIMYKKINL